MHPSFEGNRYHGKGNISALEIPGCRPRARGFLSKPDNEGSLRRVVYFLRLPLTIIGGMTEALQDMRLDSKKSLKSFENEPIRRSSGGIWGIST
jgi:hypothetical protein